MGGSCGDNNDGDADVSADRPAAPPEKMGRSFYLALLLIGILVFLVVFINYPAEKAMAGTTMTQTNWTLQSLTDSTGILVPAMSGTEVTARFGRDEILSGLAGCNQYSASFVTRDYQISITGIGSTKMFCSKEGVMQQESVFLSDLGNASSFRISGTFLRIYDAGGRPVLVFVPA